MCSINYGITVISVDKVRELGTSAAASMSQLRLHNVESTVQKHCFYPDLPTPSSTFPLI